MGDDTESIEDRQLDLLKMEYKQAAQRYENIYRAIWQNFSYLAAVSAGILAFGSRTSLPTEIIATVALLPLSFWFLATFVPLDRYGALTRIRLANIEHILNEIYFSDAGERECRRTDKHFGEIIHYKQLHHYSGFYGKRSDIEASDCQSRPKCETSDGTYSCHPRPTYGQDYALKWRARSAVLVFGWAIVIAFLVSLGASLNHYTGLPGFISSERTLLFAILSATKLFFSFLISWSFLMSWIVIFLVVGIVSYFLAQHVEAGKPQSKRYGNEKKASEIEDESEHVPE